MKPTSLTALIAAAIALAACNKSAPDPVPAPVVAPAPAEAAPAPAAAAPVQMTSEQRQAAEKQAKLDFAKMEDKYINDARAQWAETANASSTFDGEDPGSGSLAKSATGSVDGKAWTNNNQDIGFDWIEFGYAKPVSATEVRLVVRYGKGIEALSKVELQNTEGKWNTVWEGLSDVKEETRGNRTWFVRTFDKTPYKVKAVKYTIANNVQSGYKEVDAAQLVGD